MSSLKFSASIVRLLPVLLSLYLPHHRSIGLSFECTSLYVADLFHEDRAEAPVESITSKRSCVCRSQLKTLLESGIQSPLKKALLTMMVHQDNLILGAWGEKEQFNKFCTSITESMSHEGVRHFDLKQEIDYRSVETELLQMIRDSSSQCAVIIIHDVDGMPMWFRPLLKSITDQNIFTDKFLPFQVLFVVHFPHTQPVSPTQAFDLSKKFSTLQHRVLHLIHHISLHES